MKSRFVHLRSKAVELRQEGLSLKSISASLGIPLSTLSGWLRHIELSSTQKEALENYRKESLTAARILAAELHRGEKQKRIVAEEASANNFLNYASANNTALEIALAFLYLGEGAKTQARTALGSSDPRIAKFFIESIVTLYNVPRENIHCNLHLRADQNSDAAIKYWSETLELSKKNFGKTSFDLRTAGKSTYSTYKGVCLINCGRVDIQRRLMYIANGFCDRVSASLQK